MEYYYTLKELISTDKLTINYDEAKHLIKVLRKKSGEEIFVTDGEGSLYKVNIGETKKHSIECSIISKETEINEQKIKVTLYQSLLKNPDRFEFVIEKATELGVHKIVPLVTHNVINKSKDKTQRWQSIALSAMKQSQRCFLPKVETPFEIESALINCNDDIKVIAHEKSSEPEINISNLIFEGKGSLSLFIGPEGGFADEEIQTAVNNNFQVLNLGKRKFRSETAAILSLGLILYNH